jgi:UDP-glucose 4-epimerase
MVLPSFAAQAVAGEPITVYGTGEQSRCFAHVNDAVEAIQRLLADPSTVGQVFNVGSDREVTINQLAEMVRDEAGSSSPIVHIPYDEAYAEGFEDMDRRVPDLTKLQRAIGYKPATPLEEVVADVVAEQRAALTESTAEV